MGKKINITDEQREHIIKLAGYGLRDNDIANIVGYSETTLKARCARELSIGRSTAKMHVVETAFSMATSGKFPVMTIFWLKTQGRWSDKVGSNIEDEEKKEMPKEEFKVIDQIEASKIYQKIMGE